MSVPYPAKNVTNWTEEKYKKALETIATFESSSRSHSSKAIIFIDQLKQNCETYLRVSRKTHSCQAYCDLKMFDKNKQTQN